MSTPFDGPLVFGSYHTGAKSSPLTPYSSYGSLGALPKPSSSVFGLLSSAPPCAGMAKRPCLNVCAVRRGPAAWMPGSSQNTSGAAIRLAPVPTPSPQYQFNGSTWVEYATAG